MPGAAHARTCAFTVLVGCRDGLGSGESHRQSSGASENILLKVLRPWKMKIRAFAISSRQSSKVLQSEGPKVSSHKIKHQSLLIIAGFVRDPLLGALCVQV